MGTTRAAEERRPEGAEPDRAVDVAASAQPERRTGDGSDGAGHRVPGERRGVPPSVPHGWTSITRPAGVVPVVGPAGEAVVTAPGEPEPPRRAVPSDARRWHEGPPEDGRVRPVIGAVRPQVDGGRYPAKAAVGDVVTVEADVVLDGHDVLACEVRHQAPGGQSSTFAMRELGNDRWQAAFPVGDLGIHSFAVVAVVDRFAGWRRDLLARVEADQSVDLELLVGAEILEDAASRAEGADRDHLLALVGVMRAASQGLDTLLAPPPWPGADTLGALMRGDEVLALAGRYRDTGDAATSSVFSVQVDPRLARFSTWYELFPRSTSPRPGEHGTFADVEARLPYLSGLGIDVLYLPPIHPIGTTSRKGRDGVPVAGPDDPGSPWAIGSAAGGHTAVHPELGTMADFDRLVSAAAARGIAVALDLAFQCSPDHPWVGEHPEWFRHRPDGSIRYAENPPKRYEDIYPLDFETTAWRELWDALLEVVEHWIGHGVTVFRVDNPHTKPFRFWEWLIATVKGEHPEVIFLAEAFTRPTIMKQLAKAGFTQSYTYFAWRNAKWELESYLTELTRTDMADYFRPNFWPNTPDILTEALQTGGTATFVARLVLAATLGASYGIYGPAFELQEHVARSAGSEEYLDSEKYAVRHWDIDRIDSLAALVGRINRIRHENPALQHDGTLHFHRVHNDQLIAYSKTFLVERPAYLGQGGAHEPADPNAILVVVNLDPVYRQSGWVELDLGVLGIDPEQPYELHELLTDSRYQWTGQRNFVILDPDVVPAHIFRVHRHTASSR